VTELMAEKAGNVAAAGAADCAAAQAANVDVSAQIQAMDLILKTVSLSNRLQEP
jgi:hypothetical protein